MSFGPLVSRPLIPAPVPSRSVRPRSAAFLLTLLALLAAPSAGAQQADPAAAAAGETRRVVLTTGEVYVGTVEDEGADPVVLLGRDGIRREFPRARVATVAPLIRGRFYRTDPVRTRLFFAPTARTLGDGEVRGELTYVYPSVTAGLSDRVDVLASGFATFGTDALFTPLVGLKVQVARTEGVQVALGTSAAFAFGQGADGGFLAVPYGVATFGDATRSVSVGVGGAFGGTIGSSDVEVGNGVFLGVGGELQVSNGVLLFVEAVGGTAGDETGVVALPGVRFFGNRFAFDVAGVVLTDFEEVAGVAPAAFKVSYRF